MTVAHGRPDRSRAPAEGRTLVPSSVARRLGGGASCDEPQLDAQPECSELGSATELVELPSSREEGARRSVLGRVDCVIGAFDRADGALTLHELTERTGLPKSTVHRMVDQLVAIGWIEREVSGYRIGMRLFEIGGLASRRSRLSDLAARTCTPSRWPPGSPCRWRSSTARGVVYLERIPMKGFRLPTRQGGRQPAYCTALGKAMLAFDDEAAAGVLAEELPERTSRTLTKAARPRARAGAHRRDRARLRSPGVLRGAGVRGRPAAQQRTGHRRGVGHRTGGPHRPPCRRRRSSATRRPRSGTTASSGADRTDRTTMTNGAGSAVWSVAPRGSRRRGGRRRSAPRRGAPTSCSCCSTTWASATSDPTDPRSRRRRSTGSRPTASGSRTTTPRRCARPRGRRSRPG